MLSQRGIAFILLIWGFLIITGIAIASEASGHHLSFGKTLQNSSSTSLSPTPAVDSASITLSSIPLQKTNQVVNNAPTVTHDGSRTGPIVDYYSYCDQKTIKVYENELMPFKLPNGNTIYSTKGDIDCYDRNHANNNSTSGNNPGTSGLIPCIVGGQTYMLTSQQCQNATYIPPDQQLISCTITYCGGSTATYQFTPATCTQDQQIAQEYCNTMPTTAIQIQPILVNPTPDPSKIAHCKSQAAYDQNSAKQICYATYGGDNSVSDTCLQQAQTQYNAAVSSCSGY